jgi:hypothetical protein
MVEPGDEIKAGMGGHGELRASHADREQAINRLKVAFVQGRLGRDEFDLRVGQVLASRTYADLAALTADILAGPTGAQPLEPARQSDNVPTPKTIARVTAAGAGVSMVFIGAELMESGGNPVTGLVVVGMTGFLVATLIAGLLMFLSYVFKKRSSRQPAQGTPSASGKVAQRLASADPAGQLPQISHEPRHTAEAVRNDLPRLPLASLRPPLTRKVAVQLARVMSG